ncbi:MAG: ABC-2 type transporter [Firmicutes bacterium ADurb.Bin506]|jgi:ABC-2 type transport system permease protein|nr:MAG: ABC-2 type transporter [Firmicutes bacterium ADurb.Bin506]
MIGSARGASELRSSLALVKRNLSLVRRDGGWELVYMAYEVVNVLTIGFIGVSGNPEGANDRVLFLVAGALLWGFLSMLFHEVAESVAWERWEGTIEYSFMAPQSRVKYMAGVCMWGICYGLVRTMLCLAAVTLAFSISLEGANLWAALVTLAASSLAFIGMGLAAAVLPLISPEKGSPATHIFQALVLLVSGVYYDVSVLPAWMQPLSALSPATYTLRAARAALLDGASVAALSPELVKLLVLGIVLVPLGYAVFRAGERYAMRTGKLKRNG